MICAHRFCRDSGGSTYTVGSADIDETDLAAYGTTESHGTTENSASFIAVRFRTSHSRTGRYRPFPCGTRGLCADGN